MLTLATRKQSKNHLENHKNTMRIQNIMPNSSPGALNRCFKITYR